MEHILSHDDMAAYQAPQQHARSVQHRITPPRSLARRSPSGTPDRFCSVRLATQEVPDALAARRAQVGHSCGVGDKDAGVAKSSMSSSSSRGKKRLVPSGLTLLPSPAEDEREPSDLLQLCQSTESNACTEETFKPKESAVYVDPPGTIDSLSKMQHASCDHWDGQDVNGSIGNGPLHCERLGAVWPGGGVLCGCASEAMVQDNDAGAGGSMLSTSTSEKINENEIIAKFLEQTSEERLCQ
jgi:hypothetical protein